MESLALIRKPIEQELQLFRKYFQQSLETSEPYLNQIFSHISRTNGKLMRPMLLLLVAKEHGDINQSTFLSAVTLEMLHIASLVHDDVVDESNQRRGHASVNATYGNKVAVLTGDYLLSNSLIKAAQTLSIDIVNHVALLGRQLSSGELLQLKNSEQKEFSEESYLDVIRLKTAALFAMSAELGALSTGAAHDTVERMKHLGEIIGMCFQIRDDIFDYYEDSTVGKPTGNDMAEGKLTLPIIHALKKENDPAMLQLAQKVKEGTISSDEIAILIDYAKKQGGIEYATTRMNQMADEALTLIENFRQADVREALTHYIHFVTARTL
ncbi:MAG: polyprenyl synthetase family protein [Bacteroidaceae bacterium]|nr:polyprenyl synthetase family protein [Bacteroidaceae bacterium]